MTKKKITDEQMIKANPYNNEFQPYNYDWHWEVIESFLIDWYEFYKVQKDYEETKEIIREDLVKNYCQKHQLNYNNVNQNEIIEKIWDNVLTQAYSDGEAITIHLHWDKPVSEKALEKAKKYF